MREWLPENFTPPQGLAGKIAKNAIKRGRARRRNERLALSFCSFLFVACFSYVLVNNMDTATNSPVDNAAFKSAPPQAEDLRLPVPAVAADSVGANGGSPAKVGAIHESPSAKTETANNRFWANPELPLQFSKVDHSVSITWGGKGKYAVYKCDSPKFDACSMVQVVEGNKYLDKDENSGKIVYYRIEPLGKKG
jgi:hypothetical protein